MDKDYESRRFLNVVAIQPDRGATGWLRVRQPLKAMRSKNLIRFKIFEKGEPEKVLVDHLGKADIVLARTTSGTQLVKSIAKVGGASVVFDHDDDMLDISPASQHYMEWGLEDVKVTIRGKEQWMWKHGVNGFDKFKNRHSLIELQSTMVECDVVTAASIAQAEEFMEWCDKVTYVPNCIDFEHYPQVEVRDPNKKGVRIIWNGGASHLGDMVEIAPQIDKVLKQNKNVEFHSFGNDWRSIMRKPSFTYGWSEFTTLPYRMKMIDPDIAIIPLQDTLFNRRKAGSKFHDFCALGIPSVVRKITPYDTQIEDGVNGFLYASEDEFNEKVNMLIKDEKKRKKVGKNAYEWAREHRDIMKRAPEILKVWNTKNGN